MVISQAIQSAMLVNVRNYNANPPSLRSTLSVLRKQMTGNGVELALTRTNCDCLDILRLTNSAENPTRPDKSVFDYLVGKIPHWGLLTRSSANEGARPSSRELLSTVILAALRMLTAEGYEGVNGLSSKPRYDPFPSVRRGAPAGLNQPIL